MSPAIANVRARHPDTLSRAPSAVGYLTSVLLLLATSHARSQSLECSDPVCIAVSGGPPSGRILSGDRLEFNVQFAIKAGHYPNGVDFEIDPPDYFTGNAIGTSDLFEPHLRVTPTSSPAFCILDTSQSSTPANPWNVVCGQKRKALTVATSSVDTAIFSIALWSQRYDTPRGYEADVVVRFRGDRSDNPGGQTTLVTGETQLRVTVWSEANPALATRSNYAQYTFPAGAPQSDVGRSEGLTVARSLGISNFPYGTNGGSIRARVFAFSPNMVNRIMPISVRNSSTWPPAGPGGDLYDPPLSSEDDFDTGYAHPTTGTEGTNQLRDYRFEMRVPSWVMFDRVENGLAGASTPTAGSISGGTVLKTFPGPNAWSSNINANSALASSPPDGGSYSFGAATVRFLIPCSVDLATLDTQPTVPGTQLPTGSDLFEVTISATERRIENGMTTSVDHEAIYAPFNPLSGVTLSACPDVVLGLPSGGNSKSSSVRQAVPDSSFDWAITYRPLTNWTEGYGDIAILDFVAPFTEVRAADTWTGASTPHSVLGAPWFCVLPRPALSIPDSSGCPEWTSTGSCAEGGRHDYAYDPAGYFDPLPRSMGTPYDPLDPPGSGLAWNDSAQMGCLRASEICSATAARGDYGGCTVGQNDKRAWAHEVTAVIWRSDGDDTPDVDGWPGGTDADGSPTTPANLALTLPTWTKPVDPPPSNDPRVAWTLNRARLYGGSFDPFGDGGTQILGNGSVLVPEGTSGTRTLNYAAAVTDPVRIDSRWTMTTQIVATTTLLNRGDMTILNAEAPQAWIHPNSTPLPFVGGVEAWIDLPRGFDPVSDPANPTSSNWSFAPVTVPPNPVGLTGTLTQAIYWYRDAIQRPVGSPPVAAGDLDVTLTWVPSPTTHDPNDGYWRIRFRFADTYLTHGFQRRGSSPVRPLNIRVTPRTTYPFVAQQGYLATVTATAPEFDRYHDNNFRTYGGTAPSPNDAPDPADVVTNNVAIRVAMTASAQLVIEPTCVPGRTGPSFLVHYRNTGGVHLYGISAILQIPESLAGALPIHFESFTDDTPAPTPSDPNPIPWRPPDTNRVVEVATNSNDALAPNLDWTPLAAYAGQLSDIRLVRVRYADAPIDANRLPAWSSGTFRVDLATPGVTTADIGQGFSTQGYIGSSLDGVGVLALTPSDQSPLFLIGQCPGRLRVDKFFDFDGNGLMDGADYPLPGWPVAISPVAGDSNPVPALVDNSPRTGLTGTDGGIFFDVWPGQIANVSETLPAPELIGIPGYPSTQTSLAWSVTTAGGAERMLPMIDFDDLTSLSFGNTCQCGESNLCVAATCVPPATGQDAASCDFAYSGPASCDAPGLCESGEGQCDPATGECAYGDVSCAGPTLIYAVVESTGGTAIGSIVCQHDASIPSAPTITCLTRVDDAGRTVLDVRPGLYCGE